MTNEDGDILDEYFERGGLAEQEGRPHDAIAEWKAGLAIDPTSADLHYNVGVTYANVGEAARAIPYLREAMRLRVDFYEPRYVLATILYEQWRQTNIKEHCHELEALCRDALSLNPADQTQEVYLLQCLSMAEWKLGDRNSAVDTIRKSIAIDPDNVWSYDTLWWMLLRLGRRRESWDVFRKMVRLSTFSGSDTERGMNRTSNIFLGCVALGGAGLSFWLWRKGRR